MAPATFVACLVEAPHSRLHADALHMQRIPVLHIVFAGVLERNAVGTGKENQHFVATSDGVA